jgi:hypothetical protein
MAERAAIRLNTRPFQEWQSELTLLPPNCRRQARADCRLMSAANEAHSFPALRQGDCGWQSPETCPDAVLVEADSLLLSFPDAGVAIASQGCVQQDRLHLGDVRAR